MSKLPNLSAKEYMILEMLIARPGRSGSELVADSDGELKRGTVYTTLIRMIEKGYVKSKEGEQPPWGGPKRRYYTVTGLGDRVYRAHSVALGMLEPVLEGV